MPTCPRCQQFVEPQAISCPTCRLTLKAHGHPGMTLHRSTEGEYLCDTCTYHADDSCNFPQRPFAKECTLYHNPAMQTSARNTYKPSWQSSISMWMRRHTGLIALVGLLAISLIIASRR